jgi:hypothetical protein
VCICFLDHAYLNWLCEPFVFWGRAVLVARGVRDKLVYPSVWGLEGIRHLCLGTGFWRQVGLVGMSCHYLRLASHMLAWNFEIGTLLHS